MPYLLAVTFFLLYAMLAPLQMDRRSRHADQPSLLPCSAINFDAEKLQRPSPPGCSDMKFSDGSMIVVQYGRPKLRKPFNGGGPREVFGFVVPWGKVWRAGADEATSFVTDANLMVGDKRVPAGAYTLYVLPERRKPWKLILNKTTGQWGMPYPGASTDFARFDMETTLQRGTVDQLTIDFESLQNDSTKLTLQWEGWRAAVNIVKQE